METRIPVRFLDRHSPPHIATLVLITSISSLSMNIFLASLPAMAIHFETTPAILQYSISGYVFLSGIIQLVIGPLSDRYGRRRVLLVSISIFVVVSTGAAYSPNIEIFLLCRVLQTSIISGHVLSRAIARDIVGATRSASLIGYMTMGMALVPMVAPPIGGILQELSGWQANFLVQTGFAMVALILVYFDLGETASRATGGFSRLFGMLPELIRSRRFWGYSVTGAFTAGTFFAYLGGSPFVGARVYGLEPGQIGFYFCFAPIGYFFGNAFSGRFAVRVGMRRMVVAGAVIVTLGMGASLVCLLAGATHALAFFGFTVFIGIGNGLTLPSANAGIMSVRPELAGAAAGIGGSLMTLGGGTMSLITGNLVALETNAEILLVCILISGCLGIIAALYTARVEALVRNI